MAHILIVEDEKAISDLIALNVTITGHTAVQAQNGKEALSAYERESFDLLLLDVMLPDTDGFSLYRKMRPTPAIFVTALGETKDKVQGFTLGADDYLVKPFEVSELLMRINAVLRRTRHLDDRFEAGGVVVDFTAKTVRKDGAPVELTMQEFALLEALIRNRNIAQTRQKLLRDAWGVSFMGESRTVDVHIQRLRKKLDWEERIKTVYKCGYRFEDRT